MKTQHLISELAKHARPIPRNEVARRLGRALLVGLTGGTLLLVAVFGIDSDMPEQILTLAFWIRLSFPLVIIAAAVKLVERLARPGMALVSAWLIAILPVAAMALGAICFILTTWSGLRLHLVLGEGTLSRAIANVVLFSAPPFFATIHAVQGLAPTRLALAGAGAGLLAGAQGGLISVLYSPDMSVPYWSIMYILALLITTAIGAALGPRYLRW